MSDMKKWVRARFQPNVPLGEGQVKATASKEHLALARRAGREGIVLLKNENHMLPVKKGTRLALFGKGVFDYVKGGGGSGDVTVSHVRNLYDGLLMREEPAELYEPLAQFYRKCRTSVQERRYTWHDCRAGTSARASKGSQGECGYGSDHNQPLFRRGMGQAERGIRRTDFQ